MKVKLIRDLMRPRDNDETVRPANSRGGKILGLCLKMHEEAQEIANDPTDIEEYADLLTVMLTLANMHGIQFPAIHRAMERKTEKFGAFDRSMILEVRQGTERSLPK